MLKAYIFYEKWCLSDAYVCHFPIKMKSEVSKKEKNQLFIAVCYKFQRTLLFKQTLWLQCFYVWGS